MKDIKDWLDGWDALNVQRKEIEDLWEKVHAGDTASIYKADEKSTDLHELESDFAQSAAEILRELYINSTLPEERGEKSWQHMDGTYCKAPLLVWKGSSQGVCEEHDRQVFLR